MKNISAIKLNMYLGTLLIFDLLKTHTDLLNFIPNKLFYSLMLILTLMILFALGVGLIDTFIENLNKE